MIEIIEHKGYGHPDTICDIVVEKCATFLDSYYMETYGKLLHYNVDKALFLAGDVDVKYNNFEIKKLPKFILGGQVSNMDYKLENKLSNLICVTINQLLPNINNDFIVDIQCNNVSRNLSDIASNVDEIILANDTSFGVAHFPNTKAEQLVLDIKVEIEKMIDETEFPIGEDFKIMKSVDCIYISTPVYYNSVSNFREYLQVLDDVKKHLEYKFDGYKFKVNPDSDGGFPYLTRSGSSVECGDDGQVGRGNRMNGLITPMMPMTMEAFSGKNNKNHTGKLYQKLSLVEAERIYNETGKPTKVTLISKIGKPITDYDIVIEHFNL